MLQEKKGKPLPSPVAGGGTGVKSRNVGDQEGGVDETTTVLSAEATTASAATTLPSTTPIKATMGPDDVITLY